MAEFAEVMKQLNRLCKAHPNCEDNECPIHAMGCCGNIGSHCSEPLQTERIENVVMQWAKEHPEPVYPTWGEWFMSTDVLMLHWDKEKIIYSLNTTPIPAEIAEKLGIEPKEG